MMNRSDYRLHLYPIFEEEARMFGMPMSNFFNFAMVLIVFILAPMIIGGFGIELGWWYYIPGTFIILALWIFLKAMGKKAYPNFILAYLSQRVMQPKRMTCENFKLEFMTLADIQAELRNIESTEENTINQNTNP